MQAADHFDLAVIGGGPSGYAAAMRALDFGKRVALIEKSRLGGAGVSDGALSSKTWWALSQEAASARAGMERYGMAVPSVSFADVRTEVKKAVDERIQILEEQARALPGLEVIQGTGRVLENNRLSITRSESSREISADHIILATGSHPRHLPGVAVDEKIILTSDGIEHLDHFPESLVIIGAGVIGCEYATIFSGFGQTKVYLIDKGDRILPFEDADVVEVIERNMEASGVHIHRNSRLASIRVENGRVHYELEFKDGRTEHYEVEKALISIGRVPTMEDLWDASVQIKTDSRGIVSNGTDTGVSGIHVAGDLTADISLVNVAELEGRHAVEQLYGNPKPLIRDNISTIMFLHPEVAGVGMNEIRAAEMGMAYRVATMSYRIIPRAIAMRATQGFIKLLVTDDEEMKILGMRVVGHHSSSSIQAVAVLISMNGGIEELAECIHPHPSITEGIQECVRALLGKSILKPLAMGERLTCRSVAGKTS